MVSCPECDAACDSPVGCGSCGILGSWEETPTPFELFGLEQAWQVDGAGLKKKLLQYSRLCHPDFFTTQGAELRDRAERNSAELNEAFEVLRDEFRRASWLIEHLGGPNEQSERQMPQAFLMEVLDWNETLEDARAEENPTGDNEELEELARRLGEERGESMNQIAMLLDPLPSAGSESLIDVRKLLNSIRYIDRTLREIRALRLQRSTSH